MKRVLSLVLVVVMLLCFGACDKKNDDNNGTPTEAAGNTYTGASTRGVPATLTIDGTQATIVMDYPETKDYVEKDVFASIKQVSTMNGTVENGVFTATSGTISYTIWGEGRDKFIEKMVNTMKWITDDQVQVDMYRSMLEGNEVVFNPIDHKDIWEGTIGYKTVIYELNSDMTFEWLMPEE